MPRKYRHIKKYEKEIVELKSQGLTLRAIGEKLGFSLEQGKEFFKWKEKIKESFAAGIGLKQRGWPPKEQIKMGYVYFIYQNRSRSVVLNDNTLDKNFFSILKT